MAVRQQVNRFFLPLGSHRSRWWDVKTDPAGKKKRRDKSFGLNVLQSSINKPKHTQTHTSRSDNRAAQAYAEHTTQRMFCGLLYLYLCCIFLSLWFYYCMYLTHFFFFFLMFVGCCDNASRTFVSEQLHAL